MDFLVIDDDKTFRDATCLLIEEEGHYAEPAGSGEVGLATLKEDKFDAVLLDVNLGAENGLDVLEQILKTQPNMPVVMFTAQGTVKTAVEAMRRGAMDFLEKPFTREQLHNVLARLKRFNQMSMNIERLEEEVKETKSQNPELLLDFTTPLMREVMDVLLRAAKTPASILIMGESGTGKSVVARAIHQAKPSGGQAVHHGELPQPFQGASGKRIVRPCEGRVHGRGQRPLGQSEGRFGRHAVPG